jgi:hypothetical protein
MHPGVYIIIIDIIGLPVSKRVLVADEWMRCIVAFYFLCDV